MKRVLPKTSVEPKLSEDNIYTLMFSEMESGAILNLVQTYAVSKNLAPDLCLPVNVVLHVKQAKQTKKVLQSGSNLITNFKFLHSDSESGVNFKQADNLSIQSSYAEVLLLMSSEPDKSNLSKSIKLNLLSDSTQVA
jgi:hypothetical protein